MHHEAMIAPARSALPSTDSLVRFLSAYWLRPENALWMTLRSAAWSDIPLAHPNLDACCGDGVFSFLHLGGEFDSSFDVYRGVPPAPHAFDGRCDVYDCAPDEYRPRVVTAPHDRIDVGSDWKASLLAKAERLNFYGRLVKHDHNERLPFADESFQTIYCNAAYWMRDVDALLREFRRVLHSGGQLILQVKLDAMRRYTLDEHRAMLGDEVLHLLGGDRLDCWPSLGDRRTWENRFRAGGLQITDALPFVTRTHALLWYVGLRPLAPLLMRMTAALNEQTRLSIKRDWVALFETLLTPLCRPDLDLSDDRHEPAEMQYVLGRA